MAALITLGNPEQLTGGYLYQQRLAAEAARHGATIRFYSVPDLPFPLTLLAGRQAALQAARSEADILLVDSIAAAWVAPWLLSAPPRQPRVGLLHQIPGGFHSRSLYRELQRRLDLALYRRMDRLLVLSDWLADQAAGQGLPRERIRVVQPGREQIGSATVPADDQRRGRQAALLCVANWLEHKGIHLLLEAIAGLPMESVTLHLVGNVQADRRYAARLRTRLAQPDLANRVVVHGAMAPAPLATLYRSVDLFVLLSPLESYGIVYTEAMAAGLPVIGWRAGNLPYLVEHEREGLLIPTGDLEALRAALLRAVEDDDLRRRLGAAARSRASSWPTWEQTAERFFESLRELQSGDSQ